MVHSSERWKSIESLFHDALELQPEARAAFLEERCGTDLEMRRELESLLASAEEPLDLLQQKVMDAARDLTATSERNRIAPGRRLGRYEVVEPIGSGGMGEVYLATDTQLKRKVAIKVLSHGFDRDPRGLRRFEQEALAASALNHPNILTIYEFGEANGVRFIATEYVDGETLRERLARERMELSAILDVAVQIARALCAAHTSGIVHRDIKPENVMIRTDGLVKVLDFGIAKLSESPSLTAAGAPAKSISMSMAGLVIGSARYMSPEQARGQAVDARSDIFSLGVVLYEMAAGRAPFEGETVSDVIAEILKGTPLPLSQVDAGGPPRLHAIVNRAMCRDREARYHDAREMLAGLEALAAQLQREPVAAATRRQPAGFAPAAGARETPAGEQRPWPLRVLAIAAVIAVLALGWLYAVRRGSHAAAPAQAQSRTLAILPFRNLRQDASLNYLGFSLSDAITTELSGVSALTLRPSSSVTPYRDRDVDVRTVAKTLNVNTVLTGGFLKDGDDLWITTQLVDVRANKVLWQDSMRVKYDRLLEVQDRVSHEIVKGLELNLSPAQNENLSQQKPENAQAYEEYLRGIDYYAMGDFPAAISMLEQSSQLDPNYAPTWASLGRAFTTSATLRLGGRDQYDKAQAAYEKAMALNPTLPAPRIYMANMLTDTGRVEEAVPLLRAVLPANPNNAELHWELGYAYRFAGMLPQSVDECERARQIDPEVKIGSSAMNSYLYLGEYDKFVQSLPNLNTAYVLFYRGLGEYYESKLPAAAADFDRAWILQPSLLPAKIGEALSDSMNGKHQAAVALLGQTEDEMEQRGVTDPESMYKVAQAYAVLGEQAAALHALSHTIEGGFFCDACFSSDPLLKSLRGQPEFQHLVAEAQVRHAEFAARFF